VAVARGLTTATLSVSPGERTEGGAPSHRSPPEVGGGQDRGVSTLDRARRALDAGIAANAAGRPAEASRRFRAVLRAVDQAGSGHGPAAAAEPGLAAAAGAERERSYLRARATLGLVMSDFELRADVPRSLAALEEAGRWARAAGADAVRVAVDGQAGLLWLRSGEPDRALAALDAAAAGLDLAEPLDGCVVLLNRGTLHLERGDVGAARADLEACAARATAMGDHVLAFKAQHNLGYAEFVAGDLPRALATMGSAAESKGGLVSGIPLLDRAQVLLEAGLVTEADDVLGAAAEIFAAERLGLDLAQVELARAQCALLLGRPEAALAWASSARRRLARRANAPWLARAELAGLRARLEVAQGESDVRRSRRGALAVARGAQDLAERVAARRGERDVVRAARVLRAAALVAGGSPALAREALAHAGRLTGAEPLTLALSWRAAAAQLAFESGRTAAGRRHVAAGQDLLAAHRRQLGSVEAVTAAAVLGERVALLDVGAALRADDPAAVLEAVERGRATFAGPARVRPPADPRLAELLIELRQAVERERYLPPEQTADLAAAAREVDRLRTAARERSWQLGGELGAPPAPRAADVLAEVRAGAPTLVDLVVHGGTVHAVVVEPSGPRLVHLARVQDVEPVARRVATDLQVLGSAMPPAMREAVRGSLRRGLARLDALLLEQLDLDGAVRVAAGGSLVTLPWGLLPSRHGLATTVGTRVADGPASGGAAPGGHGEGTGAAGRRPGVVAVAGPGLRHADTEAGAVAAAWRAAAVAPGPVVCLGGAEATVAATAHALRTAGVVHLAVHGRHEVDNPAFSSVRLADGPLFAHELEGADLRGSVVVLSACEVGRATARPGGEVLGLASVLLRLGVDAVVAALAPLVDEVAAEVGPAFHAGLAAGLPPAQALADVVARGDDVVPLMCFGTRA
jgi:tetratricopeptide (TPR) repeat protein